MTIIELSPGQIYCSTDDRSELLVLVSWLTKNFAKMETRGQKAVTICDYIDIPAPPRAKSDKPETP